MLRDAAERAARAERRAAPTPVRAAFDRVIAEAGGDVEDAKAILMREQRAAARDGQRVVLPSAFESPEEFAERRERMLEADRQRFLAAAGIPGRYADATIDAAAIARLPERIDGEPVRAPYAAAVDVLRAATRGNDGAIVALLGTRGPGKTYMAAARIRECCRQLVSARYAVTIRYFDALKHEFRPGGNESAVERQYRDPQVLVLDEIQVKGESAWQSNRLTDLIDYRYGEGKITVLLGNVRAAQFAELVGDSIEDRVHDGGGLIECTWPSLRGRVARQPVGVGDHVPARPRVV